MSNTIVKDTQPLTTPIPQLQSKYLKHALSMRHNLKSQGLFMFDTLVKDTKPLTISISLVDAYNPKPLLAPMNELVALNFKVVSKDLSLVRFKHSGYLIKNHFQPLESGPVTQQP